MVGINIPWSLTMLELAFKDLPKNWDFDQPGHETPTPALFITTSSPPNPFDCIMDPSLNT